MAGIEAREATSARPSKDRWRALSGIVLSSDEPLVPSLPDESDAYNEDGIVDLAHWLRTTEPPEPAVPPRSSKSTKGPRKLVKRSLRSQSTLHRNTNSLSGFKPRGVEEKISKDGMSIQALQDFEHLVSRILFYC